MLTARFVYKDLKMFEECKYTRPKSLLSMILISIYHTKNIDYIHNWIIVWSQYRDMVKWISW